MEKGRKEKESEEGICGLKLLIQSGLLAGWLVTSLPPTAILLRYYYYYTYFSLASKLFSPIDSFLFFFSFKKKKLKPI